MTREDKQAVFKLLAKNFETDLFRDYFMDMVAEIPDYIFTMPSSTSGKFHNATQCQTYGQIYHEFMFDSILNHRLRLKGNQEKFNTPEIRDSMRCVPTFHDAVKCGWNGSRYTVQDHPLLAAEWVRATKVDHDIPSEYKDMIAGMCEAHSGQWNVTRGGKPIELNGVVMPEPRNEMEFFIHECDILSSRNDIDMIIPEELKEVLNISAKVELPKVEDYVFPFGKHKGEKLVDVANSDKGYISWAKENMDREPIKSLLAQL